MTNDHDYESLLWMNESDIDFSSLPDGILERLALDTEYYIATSALVEVSRRNVRQAGDLAMRILEMGRGDNHLKAVALSCLFDADPDSALPHLLVSASSPDLVLVREALNIASANPEYFARGHQHALIDRLMQRLGDFPREQLGGDLIDTFREAYSSNDD